MPLTPFRTRKLERMFSVLDVDSDGRVDHADFIRRVDTIARMCGWEEGSAEYERNLRRASDEWRSLAETVELDEDGGVTVAEFLRYGETFLSDRDAVRAYARGDVQLLFDAMDTDADGKVSLPEYRRYLQACGVDASAADVFFAHADLNEDGRITRSEMSHAMEEFLVSENPEAGGNFLFGPLDGAAG